MHRVYSILEFQLVHSVFFSQDELQSPGLWATEETGQAREGSGA